MDGISNLLTEYPWLELLFRCLVAALAGYLVHAALDRVLLRVAKRYRFAERVMWHTRRPAQWLVVLLFANLSLVDAAEPASVVGTLRQGLSIATILLVTALVIRLVGAIVDIVRYRHPTDGPDNLRARSVRRKCVSWRAPQCSSSALSVWGRC